jgi:hypothetical protein
MLYAGACRGRASSVVPPLLLPAPQGIPLPTGCSEKPRKGRGSHVSSLGFARPRFARSAQHPGTPLAAWNGGNARPALDRADLPARAGAALSAAFRTKAGIGATKERHRFGAPSATPAPVTQVCQYRDCPAFAGAPVSTAPKFHFDRQAGGPVIAKRDAIRIGCRHRRGLPTLKARDGTSPRSALHR